MISAVLGLRRHDDRLAQPVEHLLESIEVALILRGHLQLGGRDRDTKDDVRRLRASSERFWRKL